MGDFSGDLISGHPAHLVEMTGENTGDFTVSPAGALSGHPANEINDLVVARVGAHFPTESAFGVALWRSPRLSGA